jgi:hypothetical protein
VASKFMLFFVFVLWAWIPTTDTCSFHNTKDINITTRQHLHLLIHESIMQCDYEYRVNSIKRFASLGHSNHLIIHINLMNPRGQSCTISSYSDTYYILIQALLDSTIYPMCMYKSKLSFTLFEAKPSTKL